MDDQVSLPLGRYGGLSRRQWHASRAGADADSRDAYNAAMTRTPRTRAGHIYTGGKRRRGPVASQTPPSPPETIPDSEDDESVQSGDTDQPPDDYTNIKSQYDVGYSDKLLSCTGAVVAVVARSRAQLWQGSHPDSPIPFCAESEDFPVRYDWHLHDTLLNVLRLPCQHSLLHASLAVPLTTLVSAGTQILPDGEGRSNNDSALADSSFQEPNYSFLALEEHIPIPAASYACALTQKAFAYKYLSALRTLLPHVTRKGSIAQQQEVPWYPTVYSRPVLEGAALSAMDTAVKWVHHLYNEAPIMGLTRHPRQAFSTPVELNRSTPTGAYNDTGGILMDIEPCDCHHCALTISMKRFHESAPDGPDAP